MNAGNMLANMNLVVQRDKTPSPPPSQTIHKASVPAVAGSTQPSASPPNVWGPNGYSGNSDYRGHSQYGKTPYQLPPPADRKPTVAVVRSTTRATTRPTKVWGPNGYSGDGGGYTSTSSNSTTGFVDATYAANSTWGFADYDSSTRTSSHNHCHDSSGHRSSSYTSDYSGGSSSSSYSCGDSGGSSSSDSGGCSSSSCD